MTTSRRWIGSRSAIGLAVLPALTSVLFVAQPALAGDHPTDGRTLGLASNSLGPRATQLGDMDGDGKADVFTYRAQDLAWLVSYSGTSAWTVVAHGAIDPTSTWLADINGDGKSDVFSYRASDQAWLVSYSGTSDWQIINHAYLNPDVTRFGDTTGDGKSDVFSQLTNGQWVRSSGGTGAWEVINGGAFQPTTTWVGDLNGDGRDDVVAVNADYSWGVSYGGNSAWQIINNGYLDPAWTQLVDINGDGKADIFTVNSSGQWVVSYSGSSAWQTLNGGALDPSRTWLADLDGDGRADLFSIQDLTRWMVSFSTSTSWTQINNGYLPVDFPTPLHVKSTITIEDLNAQGETIGTPRTYDPSSEGVSYGGRAPDTDGAVYLSRGTGGGGDASAAGCRKATVHNKAKTLFGDTAYVFHTWISWCWSRATQLVTAKDKGWYTDINSQFQWEGLVNKDFYYYDYGVNDGHPQSAYRGYWQGRIDNCLLKVGCIKSNYPTNVLRVYYDGTYSWETS